MAEGGRNGDLLLNSYHVSVWGDGKELEANWGDGCGCTTVRMYILLLNCILNMVT